MKLVWKWFMNSLTKFSPSSQYISPELQGNSPALQTKTAVANDFTFTALLQQDPKGGRVIPVLHNLQLTDLNAAVTMLEVLADGSFISLIGQTLIKFSRDGKRLGEVKEKIPPRNVLVRKNGEILSFNENGIKLYDNDLMLLREIKRPLTDCYGLAEDSDGHLVTVNTNTRGGQITQQGTSSILVIDVGQGLVRRVIDLGDVIEASTDNKPPIDFIAFKNGFFYVVGLYQQIWLGVSRYNSFSPQTHACAVCTSYPRTV